jgi:hypothetical protein
MRLYHFSAKQQKFHRAKVRDMAAEFGHPRPSDDQVDRVLNDLGEVDLGVHQRRPNFVTVPDPVGVIRDHYRSVAGLQPLKLRREEDRQRWIEEGWLD